MKSIKGPALFLAQFAGDTAPFNSWKAITKWASDCGYKGVQVPSWDTRLFDISKAAASIDYCDMIVGQARENNIERCLSRQDMRHKNPLFFRENQ